MAKLSLPPYDLFPQSIDELELLPRDQQMYVLWAFRVNSVTDIARYYGVTREHAHVVIRSQQKVFQREIDDDSGSRWGRKRTKEV